MKLISYKCESVDCDYELEELFSSDEKIPNTLKEQCPKCGKRMKKFSLKDNAQVWKFLS